MRRSVHAGFAGATPAAQAGASLVEAMVSVVILAVGLLGLVALSTNLVQENVYARDRVQASFLAEQLIGLAVADATNGGCYAVNDPDAVCADADAALAASAWADRVEAQLPGSADTPPLAVFDPDDGAFTVTLNWRKASDAQLHRYVAATNVRD